MRIKNVIKIILGGTLAFAVLASGTFAEEVVFFCDGYVAVEDNSLLLADGDNVNVTITKRGVDWLDTDSIGSINVDEIEYYGIATSDAQGKYLIEFLPDENGDYTIYVGADIFDETRIYNIRYINKTAFLSAAEELLGSTENEFPTVLSDKKEELGLIDEIFDNFDLTKAAPIAHKALSGVTATEYEKIIKTIEKAALAAKLNDGAVSSIADWVEIAELDKISYYASDLAGIVTSCVSGKSISECDELDKLISEAVVLANVSKRSGNALQSVLKANASLLETTESKITTALCSAVSGTIYTDIKDLKEFIASYKETPGGGGGSAGGAGNGGGGAAGSKNPGQTNGNSFSGMTAYDPIGEKESFELENPFNDMTGCEWAIESVKQLYYKSIINGKEAGKFFPNDMVTREEFAKLITVATKMNLIDKDLPFNDIESDAWYAPYVRTAYIAGITKGVTETMFGTGNNITREDLCVMVCRAVEAGNFEIKSGSEQSIKFIDDIKISDYAKDSVEKLSNAGIVNGSEGYFNPQRPATRAEAAKIVNMVINNIGL